MQTSQSFIGLSAEAWLGVGITILAGYYFLIKGRKEPIACYLIRSLKVIDVPNSPLHLGKKITVNYEDTPIPRVSVANVTFWNTGTSILPGETLLPNYPLRICIGPGGKLLEAIIVINPNPECECRISFDPDNFPDSALLNFNFLEPQNGLTVRVLHTGQKGQIDVVGKLKGVPLKDACSSGKKYDSMLELLNYSGMYFAVVLVFAFFVLIQFHTWIGLPPVFFDFLLSSGPIVSKFLLGLSLLFLLSSFFISFLKKTALYRIPNELESP